MGLAALALAACGERRSAPADPAASPPSTGSPEIAAAPAGCSNPAFAGASVANGRSLRSLPLTAFGRPEIGWEIYAPLVGREIGSACPPDSSGFAAALAAWQTAKAPPADGIVTEPALLAMEAGWHARRPIVAAMSQGACPDPPDETALEAGRPGEGYGGKAVQLRRGAFAAYRAMVAAARAEAPAIAADPRNLTLFSAYRSPDDDAVRCATDGNCDGVVRATCSPHRTGLAVDLYVGEAPGFGPDSSADPNRLAQSRTPTYRWLVANAGRFGFVNYPFEPWHWEWTGEAP